MDTESYWTAVRELRFDIAALLEALAADEWERPSLCEGWRVRDVAGHLAVIPVITTGALLATGPRARFDLNRVNTLTARASAQRSPEELVAAIRQHADRRTTARVLDTRNSLFDLVVHSQDIALPLGRTFTVSPDVTRAGLDRVWAMGWPFRARRRLGHLTLQATDTDWRVGRGPEVSGPALALLLLLTGRTDAARPALHGPGTDRFFPGSMSYRGDAVRGEGRKAAPGRLEHEENVMAHYLLSVHGPVERDEFGNYGSKEEMEAAFAATAAFNDKLQAQGHWLFAGGLQPASTATVVDGQGETPMMTDGPYLETKEVIGGFWIIDAPDLDVALELAAEASRACRGKVEVRPFHGDAD